MITRIHGIDRHKHYSTISVLDSDGAEKQLIGRCSDLRGYINTLGETDAVILESSTGTFYWADLVEQQGAAVYIVNTMKFKIIRESWKKTDKEDARNLAWGVGLSRIAVMRKTIGIMRGILLNGEIYKYCDEYSYNLKLVKYRRILKKLRTAA
jgi:hypothetical protein